MHFIAIFLVPIAFPDSFIAWCRRKVNTETHKINANLRAIEREKRKKVKNSVAFGLKMLYDGLEVVQMVFHEAIQKARQVSGKKKSEVARDLKMPYSTYDGYEKGYRKPSPELALSIMRYYQLDPYLIDSEEEQAKKAAVKNNGITAKPGSPQEEEKNLSPYKFGDIPDQSKLRPMGHSKADCAIRWGKKTKDYVDLASAYGTLRITPVTPEIVRISFQKSQLAEFSDCKSIALLQGSVKWNFKESKDAFELATEKLLVRVEKKVGAVQFFTKDGKKLLSENAKEPRLLGQGMKNQSYVFFDWEKKEKLWAKGLLDDDLLKMNLSAKYISYGNRALRLPCLLSEKGYGLTFAAKDAVMCCDISVYGTYVMTEEMPQTDYYFMYGGSAGASRELYKLLTGKIK